MSFLDALPHTAISRAIFPIIRGLVIVKGLDQLPDEFARRACVSPAPKPGCDC